MGVVVEVPSVVMVVVVVVLDTACASTAMSPAENKRSSCDVWRSTRGSRCSTRASNPMRPALDDDQVVGTGAAVVAVAVAAVGDGNGAGGGDE